MSFDVTHRPKERDVVLLASSLLLFVGHRSIVLVLPSSLSFRSSFSTNFNRFVFTLPLLVLHLNKEKMGLENGNEVQKSGW